MKCGNIIKVKSSSGKTNLITCNTNLSDSSLYCHECGCPTGILSADLSAKQNITGLWKVFLKNKIRFFPFCIFFILMIISPVTVAVYFTKDSYWLNNLILLITVPLFFIPFSMKEDFLKNPFRIKQYITKFRHYPVYFQFTLVNMIYFLLLKIICTGFLIDQATDPILHLVRLILSIYWLVIVLPVPFILARESGNSIKAIHRSYKAGKETRWQQFFIFFFLILFNLGGLILLGLGLLITIPFSYILLEKYYLKMHEYNLFK